MGLISKTVMVKWHNKNKQYYIKQGYKFTKTGDKFEVKVEDLQKGSSVRVKYVCDECGCELNDRYSNYNKVVKENGDTYCKKCSKILYVGESIKKSHLKNSKSFEQWCIEHNRQDVLDRWDYELNDCKPSEINYSTVKKYWFKCDKHIEHKSELKQIVDFCQSKCEINCKQCKSLAQWMIDNDLKIEDYWDYDKNILDIWEISCGSDKKVWIKCQEKDYHGSYEVSCSNFSNNNSRCSYCSGKKVHSKDSLGSYIVDAYDKDTLNKIWASDKNEKSPYEYAPYSRHKTWWKCLDGKHEDYCRTISSAVQCNFRCPKCSEERTESIGEGIVKMYLYNLGYNILTEHSCTITPINPKTKHPLPYDNEIILDNEEHLIIEVHGEQHYNHHFYKTINKCSDNEAKQKLHYQQLKDRYKKIYAIQNGYYYLEIPYNTIFDKSDTYKKLIDNKIKEILNKNY